MVIETHPHHAKGRGEKQLLNRNAAHHQAGNRFQIPRDPNEVWKDKVYYLKESKIQPQKQQAPEQRPASEVGPTPGDTTGLT